MFDYECFDCIKIVLPPEDRLIKADLQSLQLGKGQQEYYTRYPVIHKNWGLLLSPDDVKSIVSAPLTEAVSILLCKEIRTCDSSPCEGSSIYRYFDTDDPCPYAYIDIRYEALSNTNKLVGEVLIKKGTAVIIEKEGTFGRSIKCLRLVFPIKEQRNHEEIASTIRLSSIKVAEEFVSQKKRFRGFLNGLRRPRH